MNNITRSLNIFIDLILSISKYSGTSIKKQLLLPYISNLETVKCLYKWNIEVKRAYFLLEQIPVQNSSYRLHFYNTHMSCNKSR